MEPMVLLTATTGLTQKTAVESILRGAGVPFQIRETSWAASAFGLAWEGSWPGSADQFHVPADRLQEAKDLLCAGGIVCEVSERLLRRAVDELVKPLLAQEGEERDLGRLIHFVEVNNKETLRALFEAALRETRGQELLEALFFALARKGPSLGLRVLARALRDRADASFSERFHSEATLGAKELRLVLLEVLPELPASSLRVKALAAGLRDRDAEVREVAGEALFSLGGASYAYDPDDAPAEREAVVQKLLMSGDFRK